MDSEWENRDADSLHREFRNRIGFEAVDGNGNRLGFVDIVVEDEVGRSVFFGVRTGVIGFSRMHLVPADLAVLGDVGHMLKLPFDRKILEKAPSIDGEFQWNEKVEAAVYAFYSTRGFEPRSRKVPEKV